MKTIEFKKLTFEISGTKYQGNIYGCSEQDKDHSGRWVKYEVAEKLLECFKKVSSSLENMIDCACDDDCRPKAVRQLEIAQEAIKQAEEE